MDEGKERKNEESIKKAYEKPRILKKGNVVLVNDCRSLKLRPRPK